MKTWISTLTGAIMLCALPANAAAPDYIAFTRKIDDISGFLAMIPLCRAAGYTVVPNAESVDKTIAPTLSQAIKDGIPEKMAYGMMKSSQEAGIKTVVALLDDHDAKLAAAANAGDENAVMAEADLLYKYADGRCLEYAESPKFSALITAPESGGYAHFMRWEANRAEQADETND